MTRMLREMSGDELREWDEYSELEPFGPAQEDLRLGYLIQLVHAFLTGKTKALEHWFKSLDPRGGRPPTEEELIMEQYAYAMHYFLPR